MKDILKVNGDVFAGVEENQLASCMEHGVWKICKSRTESEVLVESNSNLELHVQNPAGFGQERGGGCSSRDSQCNGGPAGNRGARSSPQL